MPLIPFAAWTPDQPLYEGAGIPDLSNVRALTSASYSPIKTLIEQGTALTARCQGAISARGVGGTIVNFAGDATKLYSFDGVTQNNVSRAAGGAYAVAIEDGWSFAQFGDYIVAVNGTDAPQQFQIGSSTLFTAVAGSPQVGRFAIVVGPHLVLLRIASAFNRLAWCAVNDISSWTPGIGLADDNDLPVGGKIMGGVGGEYGLIFTERALWRQDYVGADPVFTFNRITEELGCRIEGSLASFQQTAVWFSNDGFYRIDGGATISAIGKQKVDREFLRLVNQSFLYRVSSAFDPETGDYVISFPDTSSTDGTPNQTWRYSRTADRWTKSPIGVEQLLSYRAQAGYNTDTIDAIIGNTDATTYSTDNTLFLGSGAAALGAFTTAHKLATYSGPNLEAFIQTQQVELAQDSRAELLMVMPICDGDATGLSVDIQFCDRVTDMPSSYGYVDMDINGNCPFGIGARYFQATAKRAAGTDWEHFQGIVPKVQRAGQQ